MDLPTYRPEFEAPEKPAALDRSHVSKILFAAVSPIVPSALFLWAVLLKGIPALRHDWFWPRTAMLLRSQMMDAISPWHAVGIGQPDAYPAHYLISAFSLGLAECMSPLAALAVLLALFCALSALGCLWLSRYAGRMYATAPLLFIVLFNPWVYTKIVAGHVNMLIAYAASLCIAIELVYGKRRPLVLSLLLVCVLQQIQFFVVAGAVCLIVAIADRRFLPAFTAAILFIPIIIGITFERSTLLSIPYLSVWQQSQSLHVFDALLLKGYFTRYAAGNGVAPIIGMAMLIAAAIIGVAAGERRKRAILVLLATISALVLSLGLNGPLPNAYEWLVLHVPASALFRELYDLLAYVFIGYLLLSVRLLHRYAWSAPIFLCIGGLVAAPWTYHGPSTFWVGSSELPEAAVPLTNSHVRYALFPAFQPFSFKATGSGADPDAFHYPRSVDPINLYLPEFPEAKALSMFEKRRDPALLKALSVAAIVQRPWLKSNNSSLQQQEVPLRLQPKGAAVTNTRFIPELSLTDLPHIGSYDSNIGAGNVFFGDISPDLCHAISCPAHHAQVHPIPPPRNSLNARAQWVDARLAFDAAPTIAQSLGGIITTSRQSVAVQPGTYLLSYVTGKLIAQNGSIVVRGTGTYTWTLIDNDVRRVHCVGACLLAAWTTSLPKVPLNPPPVAFTPLAFDPIVPWLIRADISTTTRAEVLRYNVRFDRGWCAFASGIRLHHFRIDNVVNGWLLPPKKQQRTIWIVNTTALAQFSGEVVGALWALILIFMSVRGLWPKSIRRIAASR